MMAGKPLRAGLIGCGGVSREHAAGAHQAPGVELVALADIYQPNLDVAGTAYGIDRKYLDFREMITAEKLDIVLVCTQADTHAPVVIEAARLGVKGILCEKPIGVTLEEADRMIDACNEHGVRLAINHQTRMIPSTVAASRAIASGAIGELRGARMLDKGGRPAGNSLMELCTHVFDLLRIYAGVPAWVSGHMTVGPRGHDPSSASPQRDATVADIAFSQAAWPTDRDCGLVIGDRASATFGFGPDAELGHSGFDAHLHSYFQPIKSSSGGFWHPSIELLGTDGVMFLGGTSNHVDVFVHHGPWAPPGVLVEIVPTEADHRMCRSYNVERAPFHASMVDELVHAVLEGHEHRSSGVDGRWALEMIMGMYESHRHGGARVSLPLQARTHPLERWLDETGTPIPEKPSTGSKPLSLERARS